QGAVQHVVEVEDPGGGGVEDVALEHLDRDDERQGHDEPGGRFAGPVADLVDGVDHTSPVHRIKRGAAAGHPVPPGWPARWGSSTEVLALLRGRLGAEIVVVGHPTA